MAETAGRPISQIQQGQLDDNDLRVSLRATPIHAELRVPTVDPSLIVFDKRTLDPKGGKKHEVKDVVSFTLRGLAPSSLALWRKTVLASTTYFVVEPVLSPDPVRGNAQALAEEWRDILAAEDGRVFGYGATANASGVPTPTGLPLEANCLWQLEFVDRLLRDEMGSLRSRYELDFRNLARVPNADPTSAPDRRLLSGRELIGLLVIEFLPDVEQRPRSMATYVARLPQPLRSEQVHGIDFALGMNVGRPFRGVSDLRGITRAFEHVIIHATLLQKAKRQIDRVRELFRDKHQYIAACDEWERTLRVLEPAWALGSVVNADTDAIVAFEQALSLRPQWSFAFQFGSIFHSAAAIRALVPR